MPLTLEEKMDLAFRMALLTAKKEGVLQLNELWMYENDLSCREIEQAQTAALPLLPKLLAKEARYADLEAALCSAGLPKDKIPVLVGILYANDEGTFADAIDHLPDVPPVVRELADEVKSNVTGDDF